ncbi:MAG: hypothetical protein WC508_02720 [Patescibacteria group bacterium]
MSFESTAGSIVFGIAISPLILIGYLLVGIIASIFKGLWRWHRITAMTDSFDQPIGEPGLKAFFKDAAI